MKIKELEDTFYNIMKKIVDHAVNKTDWDTDTIIHKQAIALVDYIKEENIKKMDLEYEDKFKVSKIEKEKHKKYGY